MNPKHRPAHHHGPATGPGADPGSTKGSRVSGRKYKRNLVALGSAAVLAIYAAGYARTRAAAQRFEGDAGGRRQPILPRAVASAPVPTPQPEPVSPQPAVQSEPIPEVPPAVLASTEPVSPPAADIAAATPPGQEAAPPVAAEPVAVESWVPVAVGTPVAVPGTTAAPAPSPSPAQVATAAAVVAPVAESVASATVSPAPAPPTSGSTPATGIPAPVPAVAEKPSEWKDGKYSGWGSCRHGDIQASIEIRGGRIISATISSCRTVYSCDVIEKVVPQVVTRQSADVDSVSGATQSADAFFWAVSTALEEAKAALAATKTAPPK